MSFFVIAISFFIFQASAADDSQFFDLNEVSYSIEKDFVVVYTEEDPIPFKLCKLDENTYQKFRFFKNSDGTIGGIVAVGSYVEPQVILRNTSICNLSETKFVTIKGNVEIYDSFIKGGTIDSDFGSPEEGKRKVAKIVISNSRLEGDYNIYKKANFDNVQIKGNPFLSGTEGPGLSFKNVVLGYSNISESAKGVYGSVKLERVYAKGNHLIQSFNLVPRFKKKIIKIDDFDITLSDIGTKESPGLIGDSTILNKVKILKGTYKGNFCFNGDGLEGIDIVESHVDYSTVQNETVKGLVGNVKLNFAQIKGNPLLAGITPEITFKKNSNLCSPQVSKKIQRAIALPFKVNVDNSKVLRSAVLQGFVSVVNNSSLDGDVNIQGTSVDADFVGTELNDVKIITDENKPETKFEMKGNLRYATGTIKGSLIIKSMLARINSSNFEGINSFDAPDMFLENSNFSGRNRFVSDIPNQSFYITNSSFNGLLTKDNLASQSGTTASSYIDCHISGDYQITDEFICQRATLSNYLRFSNRVVTIDTQSDAKLTFNGNNEYGVNSYDNVFHGTIDATGWNYIHDCQLTGNFILHANSSILANSNITSDWTINTNSFQISYITETSPLNASGNFAEVSSTSWTGTLTLSGTVEISGGSIGSNVTLNGILNPTVGYGAFLIDVVVPSNFNESFHGIFSNCYLYVGQNGVSCSSP